MKILLVSLTFLLVSLGITCWGFAVKQAKLRRNLKSFIETAHSTQKRYVENLETWNGTLLGSPTSSELAWNQWHKGTSINYMHVSEPGRYTVQVIPEKLPVTKEGFVTLGTLTTEGRKDDTGKTPYELLPYWYLEGTARVLAFGATKYDAWNWYKGMAWGRVYGALMRHLWKWWWSKVFASGPNDPETGMSHLWHAGCCLGFLMEYEQEVLGTDDRPVKAVRATVLPPPGP